MADLVDKVKSEFGMSETQQMVRFGIGSAAAAAAVFAPLNYIWKGVLCAVAAEAILSAAYETCPIQRTVECVKAAAGS